MFLYRRQHTLFLILQNDFPFFETPVQHVAYTVRHNEIENISSKKKQMLKKEDGNKKKRIIQRTLGAQFLRVFNLIGMPPLACMEFQLKKKMSQCELTMNDNTQSTSVLDLFH